MSSFQPGSGSAQAAILNLRPLSIGEVLDRAFSIVFKNLIPFVSLVVVVIAPEVVLNYLGFKDVLGVMGDPSNSPFGAAGQTVDPTRILAAYASGFPYLLLLFVFALIVVPLSNAAVVSGVSRAYLGMPVRFADCYGDARVRWLPLLGLMFIWLFTGFIAAFAVTIAFVGLTLALGVIINALGVTGTVLAVLIGIAIGVAILLLAMNVYLAAAFSFVSAVLERLGPFLAFTSGFQRVFGEGQFWRSAATSASLFGIVFGFSLIAALLGGVAAAMTHSYSLNFVLGGLMNAVTYPFVFAVVGVSYYDVRIRREGFDLHMLAAQLGASATPSTPRQ
jgi:hypothetical protein